MQKIIILALLIVALVSTGCQSSLVNDEGGIVDVGITDESGDDISNDISELDSLTEDLEEIDEIDLTDILLNNF